MGFCVAEVAPYQSDFIWQYVIGVFLSYYILAFEMYHVGIIWLSVLLFCKVFNCFAEYLANCSIVLQKTCVPDNIAKSLFSCSIINKTQSYLLRGVLGMFFCCNTSNK